MANKYAPAAKKTSARPAKAQKNDTPEFWKNAKYADAPGDSQR